MSIQNAEHQMNVFINFQGNFDFSLNTYAHKHTHTDIRTYLMRGKLSGKMLRSECLLITCVKF